MWPWQDSGPCHTCFRCPLYSGASRGMLAHYFFPVPTGKKADSIFAIDHLFKPWKTQLLHVNTRPRNKLDPPHWWSVRSSTNRTLQERQKTIAPVKTNEGIPCAWFATNKARNLYSLKWLHSRYYAGWSPESDHDFLFTEVNGGSGKVVSKSYWHAE